MSEKISITREKKEEENKKFVWYCQRCKTRNAFYRSKCKKCHQKRSLLDDVLCIEQERWLAKH